MPEYCFNRQFENETKVRIETNDRKLLLGIEQAINDFISNFKNENEETDGIENIKWIRFENELNFGIENEDAFENELHHGIENRFEKKSENELRSSNLPKPSHKSFVSKFKFIDDETPSKIHTKWGVARIDSGGHYKIVGGKYANQQLHRLLYEDYHQVCLLDEAVIHHIDENKLNNDVTNLIAVSQSEHRRIHNMLNNRSKIYSNTDERYYRVYKQKNPKTKQGFTYKYQWYGEDGKRKAVERVNFNELERIVKSMGLPWRKL